MTPLLSVDTQVFETLRSLVLDLIQATGVPLSRRAFPAPTSTDQTAFFPDRL
jgi:hypothetical protein